MRLTILWAISVKSVREYPDFRSVIWKTSILSTGKQTKPNNSDTLTRVWAPYFFRHQPHRLVRHTQIIRQQRLTGCLGMFDHSVGLARKGLKLLNMKNFTLGCVKCYSVICKNYELHSDDRGCYFFYCSTKYKNSWRCWSLQTL